MPECFSIGRMLELGWTPPTDFKLSKHDAELFAELHPKPQEDDVLRAPNGKSIVGILHPMLVFEEVNPKFPVRHGRPRHQDWEKRKLHSRKSRDPIFVDEDGNEWFARELIPDLEQRVVNERIDRQMVGLRKQLDRLREELEIIPPDWMEWASPYSAG